MGTLKSRFDEQLYKQAEAEQVIEGQKKQLEAFELKTKKLLSEKSEAVSDQSRLQNDIVDLRKANESLENENNSLIKEREKTLK